MNLAPGSELGPHLVERVEPAKIEALAAILADPNPIHLDPKAAERAGLGDRVVGQGPASIGYAIDMLLTAVAGARLRRIEARLIANVFGGDAVRAAGVVEETHEVEGGTELRCRYWVEVIDGARAVEGTAVLLSPLPS